MPALDLEHELDDSRRPNRRRHRRRRCGASTCVSPATRSSRSARSRRAPDDRVVDATGLVLAPGVIDAHNHSTDGLDTDPDAVTQVSQGITTLRRRPGRQLAVPAPRLPREAARLAVDGERRGAGRSRHAAAAGDGRGFPPARDARGDRAASKRSSIRRCAAARSDCRRGSSTKSAATRRPRKSSPWRASPPSTAASTSRTSATKPTSRWKPIREAIAIGEKAKLPVQITHLKLGTVGVWGKAAEVVAMIEAARKRGVDVTADVYPYLAWSSNLKVLVPNKQWTNPASVKEALDDVGGGTERADHAAAEVSAVRRQASRRNREAGRPQRSRRCTSRSSRTMMPA